MSLPLRVDRSTMDLRTGGYVATLRQYVTVGPAVIVGDGARVTIAVSVAPPLLRVQTEGERAAASERMVALAERIERLLAAEGEAAAAEEGQP